MRAYSAEDDHRRTRELRLPQSMPVTQSVSVDSVTEKIAVAFVRASRALSTSVISLSLVGDNYDFLI